MHTIKLSGIFVVIEKEEKEVNNISTVKKRLEFVHITKTGGSAIEKAGSKLDLIWGACHYMNITEVGCMAPDIPYSAPNYQSYALTSPWHTPPKLLRKYVNESQYPYGDADLFTVIRNPYDRIISEYYCPWLGLQDNTLKKKRQNNPAVMNAWVQNMVTRLDKAMEAFKKIQDENAKLKIHSENVTEDIRVLAQKHFVNQVEYVYDGDNVVIKNVVHYENLSKEFTKLMEKYDIEASLPPKEMSGTYTDTKNVKRLTYRALDAKSISVINEFAKPDFEKFGYEIVEDKFDKDYTLEATVVVR
eukprot:CAMPEP_0194354538 /NCGR_PEP_ID=MMETSP0174-20130528/2679_1 /TAXON_ID=216777 /ORGANISM="Proboscia alata, Strain PI-D3" /LENGTH=301 /DNA_ID=CAMNT_0039123525 /DNA_START=113 /DNA_END=1018 /DNA_ORIENTATION=+